MLKNGAMAQIGDIRKKRYPFTMQVNFDVRYPDCVKITMGMENRVVKYSDLFSFMFTIASKEQQAKMMPVREELGHQYMKQIHVRLKKDMKEGEEMVVNVPINIPQIIEDEILAEKDKKEDDKSNHPLGYPHLTL